MVALYETGPKWRRCPSGHPGAEGGDEYCVYCGRRLRAFIWSDHSGLRMTLVVVGLIASICATVITAHWGPDAGTAAFAVGVVLVGILMLAFFLGVPIWMAVDGYNSKQTAELESSRARRAVEEAETACVGAQRAWQTHIEEIQAKPADQRSQIERDEYDTYAANRDLELARQRFASVDARWVADEESYGNREIASRDVLTAEAAITQLIVAGRYRESVAEEEARAAGAAVSAAYAALSHLEARHRSDASYRAARNLAIGAGMLAAEHELFHHGSHGHHF